jgi:hypothetical protein
VALRRGEDMMEENAGNGWKRVYTTTLVSVYRRGWLGVWDAIKAVITRNDREVFAVDYTVSVWVKSNDEVNITMYGMQTESNQIH